MPTDPSPRNPGRRRVVVVSGGTDGMGRALALARAERGDSVVVLGSNPDKGRRLRAEAERVGAAGRIDFIQVDLSGVAATRAAVERIAERHRVVDALALFANRHATRRTVTAEGLERTFALYYLSRVLLGDGLAPLLRRSADPVIVNVSGTGTVQGRVHLDDLQLERRYSTVAAQLQAGRANDLLGVAFAARPDNPIRYVLYHPGFTRSGDLSPLPAPVRVLLRVAARVAARPVADAIAPVHGFIDHPPEAPLTAIDRGRPVPLTLKTLDPGDARRLAEATEALLHARCPG
ncbi:short subunit dehydrogenase [Murinocardiopsis flavida]|uniref:Short subunit dehydrogenase n=1 Tax=Murinocardiopsis flavida TaxID=645275 RepID=A0A2P8CVE7_9ACTN|nr:SDR family NAD(P)-dependent oxidoreductase [Murinocardiopsis flavida]PSK88953.1 short subunit dehydrogenase [Murinocardiopsis flavida]